jgi:hypothetical protein
MPSIHLPESAYQHLLAEAAIRQLTAETLVVELLDRLTQEKVASPTRPLAGEAWKKSLDAVVEDAHKRADRYPPGFECDVSRESMYDEQLLRQMGTADQWAADWHAWVNTLPKRTLTLDVSRDTIYDDRGL